jgi:NAD(P)-dependent dehydrogenase (short-subunit alcohol dehydrogenase family)
MSGEFAGQSVLITGAGSGIGRQTAFSFAQAGADLILADIDESGLERTALLCRKLGADVYSRRVDVASASEMEALAEFVHARFPALDVLINNAGVGVAGDFVSTDLATWDWAISINLKGVVHGCHYFLPKMIARGLGGHVVNVASLAGLMASKQLSVYATTKFAVVGLSETLRAELATHRIGVTALCPGFINTPIVRSSRLAGDLAENPDFQARAVAFYRRRNYSPERVARAIVRAVRKRRGLVPVAPEAWLLYYAKRIAPGMVERLQQRDAF